MCGVDWPIDKKGEESKWGSLVIGGKMGRRRYGNAIEEEEGKREKEKEK